MTQSSVLSSETIRYQTNPKAGDSKQPSWFWLSCPGPVAWARQLFCGTRARCGCGQCTRPRRPEATGGSAGAARSGRGAQAWASVASGPSGGSRAARRRGGEVEPTCAGGTAGPARGAWPSPKVLTSRCPPGHAGFLFVAGGGGRSRTELRALQEQPRPHRRGQSRASAWPPPLSPGRGPRASCGESRGGRKSSGGRRGDSQGRGRPQGVTDTALRWRGPHGRRQQRISRRELGQTETSDYVLEDSPLLAACLNPSTKSLRAP